MKSAFGDFFKDLGAYSVRAESGRAHVFLNYVLLCAVMRVQCCASVRPFVTGGRRHLELHLEHTGKKSLELICTSTVLSSELYLSPGSGIRADACAWDECIASLRSARAHVQQDCVH